MFEQLLERIRTAPIRDEPFAHLYLDNVFTAYEFEAIVSAPEVRTNEIGSDDELFRMLFACGYKIVPFPGAITDRRAYLRWHRRQRRGRHRGVHATCEAAGVVVRLQSPRTSMLRKLSAFMAGDAFHRALAERFGIDLEECTTDFGIQKYLDGYEISPHPDLRKKALTYMININPHSGSEALDHHTRYLRFRPEYSFLERFWHHNPNIERCWVPWDWCEVASVQSANNSMVVFAPGSDTLHAVRARYDHLAGQRTQVYGNLWYRGSGALQRMEHQAIDLPGYAARQHDRPNGAFRAIGKHAADVVRVGVHAWRRMTQDRNLDASRKRHY